jgi:crotonobetainyl-CoA:carnitine CoA-transferase CaiB-like acyl-CoA transferase
MSRPFEGIRIIDITHVLAGPHGGVHVCARRAAGRPAAADVRAAQ